MAKKLVVYNIAGEANRNNFGAAIRRIDEDCVDVFQDHATVFESDEPNEVLFKKLIETEIDSADEVFIFDVPNLPYGLGLSWEELKQFYSK